MTKKMSVDTSGVLSLGDYLANQRQRKKMTLREVEQATDHGVSNAYLSQLEKGKISKPSPNILFHLSQVYDVPYDILMKKAGYLLQPSEASATSRHTRVATFADESLTADEEEVLLEYLAFLRSRKRGQSEG